MSLILGILYLIVEILFFVLIVTFLIIFLASFTWHLTIKAWIFLKWTLPKNLYLNTSRLDDIYEFQKIIINSLKKLARNFHPDECSKLVKELEIASQEGYYLGEITCDLEKNLNHLKEFLNRSINTKETDLEKYIEYEFHLPFSSEPLKLDPRTEDNSLKALEGYILVKNKSIFILPGMEISYGEKVFKAYHKSPTWKKCLNQSIMYLENEFRKVREAKSFKSRDKHYSDHPTNPPNPKTQKISREERLWLIHILNELPSSQFAELRYALRPPPGIMPSDYGAKGFQSSALLEWVEGPTGPGLQTLLDLLGNSFNLSSPQTREAAQAFQDAKE